ncbi:MAG: DEAD/DEAH box helicase [Kiritimatiellae bacterium]|nr:DEAD/DEAH box helicase [Kiritimatiellia bacterium]
MTKDNLLEWSGKKVFEEGRSLFEAGRVRRLDLSHTPMIEGAIGYGDRVFTTRFKVLPDGSVDNQCPCKDSRERGIVCSHVIAVALAWVDRTADPRRERDRRIRKRREAFRRGVHCGGISRLSPREPGAIPATLRLRISGTWQDDFARDELRISTQVVFKNSRKKITQVDPSLPLAFNTRDAHLLYVLEDFCEGEPPPDDLLLNRNQFLELMDELAPGIIHLKESEQSIRILAEPVQPHLVVRADRKTGEVLVEQHLNLPPDAPRPVFLPGRRAAWLLLDDTLRPLDPALPEVIQALYEGPMCLPSSQVPEFLFEVLPELEDRILIDANITQKACVMMQGTPEFELELSGRPDALQPALYVRYGKGGERFVAGQHAGSYRQASPSGKECFHFMMRNPEMEDEGLQKLQVLGIRGMHGETLEAIEGKTETLNFLARQVPDLRSQGWTVSFSSELENMIQTVEWISPRLAISAGKRVGWYQVDFRFPLRDGGFLSETDIEDAVLLDEYFIECDEKTYLLDANLVERVNAVFDDCSVRDEIPYCSLQVGDIHAGYVMSSLEMIPGVQVETDESWRRQVEKQNRKERMDPVVLNPEMENVLRSYQKTGVSWLRYMENGGFSGILADEMGLGKTVQTLAWLQLTRADESARGMPALVVCPTSLVENWAAEAEKFTPNLRVHLSTGAQRQKKWDKLEGADLVITSYALLRRDIDFYARIRFSAAILDEAQHIKNHSTQNARSTKRIKACYRLVLTGTPIENSVTDLWSILDFLMPGYLGTHQQFKYVYEMPISNRTPDGPVAQERLRRKIHPFLLRRLKSEVAKDLPPKIERVALCTMTRDQQDVYQRLLMHYRTQIYDLVRDQGFEKTRFEIFKTLLRLRQTCCHLDLLKDPGIKYKEPSGKLDLFHELLDEALDGGNRLLVFSQFVSMLQILRKELTKRGLRYSYLDGSTKERLAVVNDFNSDAGIPVFLISLKAGGTGLNLTGADTVIHFDPWWNPAVEDQATDRAHRIGQQRTVYSVKLITKDSIEEKVLAMQRRKKAIIDATLARDKDQVLEKLTWDDVQELLTE